MRRLIAVYTLLFTLFNTGCLRHRILPNRAAPGDRVQFTPNRPVAPGDRFVLRGQEVKVTAAGTAGSFEVPVTGPGPAVLYRTDAAGLRRPVGLLRVQPRPRAEVVLGITSAGYSLVASEGTASRFPEDPPISARRVSYDLIGPTNQLIWTGAVIDTRDGRQEVYDEDASGLRKLHRNAPAALQFSLRIPNVDAPVTLRLFHAAPGLDLSTAAGRAARVRVNDLAIPKGVQ